MTLPAPGLQIRSFSGEIPCRGVLIEYGSKKAKILSSDGYLATLEFEDGSQLHINKYQALPIKFLDIANEHNWPKNTVERA